MPTDSSHAGKARDLAERLLALGLLDTDEIAREVNWSLGRYQVMRKLGEGASSQVFLAEDPLIGRPVVIKLLKEGVPVRADRFQREIRVLGSLRHPRIVGILDAGSHDGRLYFVMDYVGQRTLADPELELPHWVRMLRDVALACDYAHGQGILHRDLKPGNVVVSQEGPLVLDFGVSKLLGESGDPGLSRKGLTRTGTIVGTPCYMSPEQISGDQPVGPATDVYALGVMLYERLAGRLPFHGANLLQVAAQIASEPPPPLREVAPSTPGALEAVVAQALEKDPDQRQPSAAVFAEQLTRWLDGGAEPTAHRNVAGPLALGIGLIVVGLLVVGLLSQRSPQSDLAASSSPGVPPATSGQEPSTSPTPTPTSPAPTPTPDEPASTEELRQLHDAENRFAAWNATAVLLGDPVPLDSLEQIVAKLDALLETDPGPGLTQQVALLRGRVQARLGFTEAALEDLTRASELPGERRDEALLALARVAWNEGVLQTWSGRRSLVAVADEVLPMLSPLRQSKLSTGLRAEAEALLELVSGSLSGEAPPEPDLSGSGEQPGLRLLEAQRRVLRGDTLGARAALGRLDSKPGCFPVLQQALVAAWILDAQTPSGISDLDWALRHVSWLIQSDPQPERSCLLVARLARLATLDALETGPPSNKPTRSLAGARTLVGDLVQAQPESGPALLAQFCLLNLSVALEVAPPGGEMRKRLDELQALMPEAMESHLAELSAYLVSSRLSPYPLLQRRSQERAREILVTARERAGSRWADELARADELLR